ncbi:hypothetical protein R50072_29630 [Simiduia litorea]
MLDACGVDSRRKPQARRWSGNLDKVHGYSETLAAYHGQHFLGMSAGLLGQFYTA